MVVVSLGDEVHALAEEFVNAGGEVAVDLGDGLLYGVLGQLGGGAGALQLADLPLPALDLFLDFRVGAVLGESVIDLRPALGVPQLGLLPLLAQGIEASGKLLQGVV